MNDTPAQEVREALERRIADADLVRPYRPRCHDVGQVLTLNATGVWPQVEATVELEILKRIGGGFAGQVYQTRLRSYDGKLPIEGLDVGGLYAVKILIPPSSFSVLFRDAIYGLAYQGKFSAQVNPDAIRAGALWQKLIRRGARAALGGEHHIVDVKATFYDQTLCSFGEISEWVPGRTWRYEIDDHVLRRRRYLHPGVELPGDAGSREYVQKRHFMRALVDHFHAMGAPELARQYEWYTLKSQPNALLRTDGEHAGELCAIDFRAGLALLPFLPMSLADCWLIPRGWLRGHLVQFDRGDIPGLRRYVEQHAEHFEGWEPALDELERRDAAYRASLPDVLHHHFRLLGSRLRASVREGFTTSWEHQGLVDDAGAARLRGSTLSFLLFVLVGLVPLLGRGVRRLGWDAAYRQHVRRTLTSWGYFTRRFRVRQWSRLIDWHRDERVTDARATRMADRPIRTWLLGLRAGWMPAGVFHFFTDWSFFKDKLWHAVSYPVKLYLSPQVREEWFVEQIEEGRDSGMLSGAEADDILGRVGDPYIQKYLKSVAVHACTLPITQLVAAAIAIYAMIVYGDSWAEGMLVAGAIFAFFQGTPISPGSIVRGSYVAFMMVKDRNIRDYWIAMLISFWHYIGYLAFPIQMVAKYPDLARFLGGTWATKMVRLIPVFGEQGALLEHWVFDSFFNFPLTIGSWLKGLVRRKKPAGGSVKS